MDDSIQPGFDQGLTAADFQQSVECFAKAFHVSPYVQTVTSFDTGRYLYVNDRFVKAAGYSRDEVIGRTALELNLFADKSDRTWLTRVLRRHGQVTNKKLRFRLRSGAVRMGLFTAEVFQLSGRDCILSTVSDITEQLAAEHRYRLQNTRIAIVDQLAAGLAHEVRNPLAGIKGVADAFLQRRRLTRLEREWMEAVRLEVTKIDDRLRELLDLTQPRVLSLRAYSLSELIRRVVLLASHYARSIPKRDISVEFIDATSGPVGMCLDMARIEDAVLNLVFNAVESIPQSGLVTVRLSCSQRRKTGANALINEVVIEVTDTGCGIPPDAHQWIFEPFFTTKRDGTGLGLAAVRQTAEAFNGRITFRTRVGRGSTFELALPLCPTQPDSHER